MFERCQTREIRPRQWRFAEIFLRTRGRRRRGRRRGAAQCSMGELYEVERFEGARTLRNGIGEREFLVKWKGWGADEMT